MQSGFEGEDLEKKLNFCIICCKRVKEEDFARLPCLHHEFCFECIFEWSLFANFCPLCKKKFEFIERGEGIVLVKDKELQDVDENDFRCEKCGEFGSRDFFLSCVSCLSQFHVACLGMKFAPVLNQWFCDKCLTGVGGYKARFVLKAMIRCGRKLSTERTRLKKLRDC
jgi:hypothetical protein